MVTLWQGHFIAFYSSDLQLKEKQLLMIFAWTIDYQQGHFKVHVVLSPVRGFVT